jgi:hypothetical protein
MTLFVINSERREEPKFASSTGKARRRHSLDYMTVFWEQVRV